MGYLRMRSYGGRSRTPVNNARTRELQESWDKIIRESSKPLEQGAIAKGVVVTGLVQISKPVLSMNPSVRIPSLPMGSGGTKPVVDPLKEAKQKLAPHIGQSYNKGPIQLLSEDELKEQKLGLHLRR